MGSPADFGADGLSQRSAVSFIAHSNLSTSYSHLESETSAALNSRRS
jgi:hypothetical protein